MQFRNEFAGSGTLVPTSNEQGEVWQKSPGHCREQPRGPAEPPGGAEHPGCAGHRHQWLIPKPEQLVGIPEERPLGGQATEEARPGGGGVAEGIEPPLSPEKHQNSDENDTRSGRITHAGAAVPPVHTGTWAGWKVLVVVRAEGLALVRAQACARMCAHELGTSDWGDWLPQEIAATTPDGVDIWYLGCNGFVLKAADGTTLVIDPYCGTGDPPRTVRMIPVPFDPDTFASVVDPDAVLATHEHSDHVHEGTQAPLVAGGADYFGPDDSIAVTREESWTDRAGVTAEAFTTVAEGETIEIGSLRVRVEPAHDPDASHPVSYVIEHDAGTFFHGGDARASDSFADIGDRYDIDLGALAVGSSGMLPDKETGEPVYKQWYSSPNGVAEAAAQLGLDRLLPAHWDMWKGLTADPRSVRDHTRSFAAPRSVEVVEIGDRVSV